MPALFADAGVLVTIFGVAVLVGMIMATQHTLVPLLHGIASALGGAPLIGGYLSGLVRSGENAVNSALQAAIDANLSLLDGLFQALGWSLTLTFNTMDTLARWAGDALGYLRHNALPAVITAMIAGPVALINAVEKLTSANTAGIAKVRQDAAAMVATASRSLNARISSTDAAAKVYTNAEVIALRSAIESQLDALNREIAEPATKPPIAVPIPRAEPADPPLTIPASIPRELGALAASVASIAGVVALTLTETGLNNRACRTKVKDVCATDPTAWGDLLAGLAVLGFAFNLAEMAKIANGLVGELEPVIKLAA